MDSITSSQILNILSNLATNTTANVGVLVVSIVIGAVLCFLGVKVIRYLSALIGFCLGIAIGTGIGAVADISGFTYIILIFGCAILIGVLSFFIYRISVFVFTFFVFFATIVVVIGKATQLVYIVAAVIGLILAIISMIYMEPMIIVVTAIWGGLCCGDGIAQMAKLANADSMGFVIGGVLAIIGMLLQFFFLRKKPKKAGKNKKDKKAKKNKKNKKDQAPEVEEEEPDEYEDEEDDDEYYDEDDDY